MKKFSHPIQLLMAFIGIIFLVAFAMNSESEKINGMSFEAPADKITHQEFIDIKTSNSNWISLMPYAYADEGSSEIKYNNLPWQWWGESFEGTRSCIQASHENGLSVMLKPHLWIRNGSFTGEVTFDNEKDWLKWESTYEGYILKYAELAEDEKVELFCIGTELGAWVTSRPDSWEVMIQNVKKIYSGKLTYAGNWDNYKFFPLWDQLDFIGVDAYFPLSKSRSPSKEELNKGWKKWIDEMQKVSALNDKEVLFTEFGYRNIDFTANKPWESYHNAEQNDEAQKVAYEALFSNLWDLEWLAGGFAWKWHASTQRPRRSNTTYTPQGKPALEVIKNYYSK